MLEPLMDEWLRFAEPFPKGLEEALDWVESVAGWTEAVSGNACTYGALERSIRFYRERDFLAARFEARCGDAKDGFHDPAALRLILDSGRFLSVETHAMLLAGILGQKPREAQPMETDHGCDPLLFFARRILLARKP